MDLSKNIKGYTAILVAKMQAELCFARKDDWMAALRVVVKNQRGTIRYHVERALAHEDEIIERMKQQGRLMR